MPAFLWYGMGEREEQEEKKEKMWGKNEEELGGIGLFGPFARISNSEDNRLEIRKSGMK